ARGAWSRVERGGAEKPLRPQRRSRTADRPTITPTARKTPAKNRSPKATSGPRSDPPADERDNGRSTRTSYRTKRIMPKPTRLIPVSGFRCRCDVGVAMAAADRGTATAEPPTSGVRSGLGRSAGAYRRQASHHHRSYCEIHRRAAPQVGHANFDRAFGA